MKRLIALILTSLFILLTCGNIDPIQERYEAAAESSSNLTESVSEYTMWMNVLSESIQQGTNQKSEEEEVVSNSGDFNEKVLGTADTRIHKMKEYQGKASTYMDIYRAEDSEATRLVANFVEAIGPWIVGQAEKWNVIRSCYETSTSENKSVLFLCIGSSEQAEFEKWRELDKQILKLANEVEGISTS